MNMIIGWLLKRVAERSSAIGLAAILGGGWQAWSIWHTAHPPLGDIINAAAALLQGTPTASPATAFVGAATAALVGLAAFVTHDGTLLKKLPPDEGGEAAKVDTTQPNPPPSPPNHQL